MSSPGGEELRGLFGCGEGRKQLGFDFSSLEARIQGHYVLPFPTGEELATSLIAEKPNDCFDMDTQLLAKHGWVSRKDITLDTELANWYADGTITFETPNQIVDRRTTSFINIKTDRLHIRVTPNHRIILFNRQSNKYITLEADRVGEYLRYHPDCFIPSKGVLEEGHTDSKWVRAITDLDQDCVVNYHKGSIEVYSENKEVIENLVVAQRLRGNHALMFTKRFGDTLRYQTSITDMFKNHCGFKITEQDISTEYVEEDVWCVSVNSTYVIAKKSDTMYVIGNCHTVNSIKLGITRDDAKSFSYASMYGAQADKLSKMLRISLKEAERLYVAYWEAVPALKELKDRVEAYWKKTGKQHILGIDNRKLHVRSPHSLINLLLQSAGALCVKYTIVGVARSLEEKGLLGNPFEDTFEDYKKKVYQMIVYHDECQYDCPEDFFIDHYFDTEDEAEEARSLYPESGSVSHNDKGYYFSEANPLSEIILEEIFKVCMDLDIRVPLGMEFNTGVTWGECH